MNSLQGTASTKYPEDRKYDFQELLELVSSAERFPIDFDIAWEWSGFPNRHRAKKTLLKSFTEKEDFFVKFLPLQLNSNRLSNPDDPKSVKITIDCWKSLALIARTPRGRQLRQDILQCEAIVRRNNRSPANLTVHLEKAIQKNLTLQEILSRQWCDSLQKMKLATELLNCSTIEDVRDTYIEILTSSCQELSAISSSVEKLHSISELENFQARQELPDPKQLLTA